MGRTGLGFGDALRRVWKYVVRQPMLSLLRRSVEFGFYHCLLSVVDRVSKLRRNTTIPEAAWLHRESIALKAQLDVLKARLKREEAEVKQWAPRRPVGTRRGGLEGLLAAAGWATRGATRRATGRLRQAVVNRVRARCRWWGPILKRPSGRAFELPVSPYLFGQRSRWRSARWGREHVRPEALLGLPEVPRRETPHRSRANRDSQSATDRAADLIPPLPGPFSPEPGLRR